MLILMSEVKSYNLKKGKDTIYKKDAPFHPFEKKKDSKSIYGFPELLTTDH